MPQHAAQRIGFLDADMAALRRKRAAMQQGLERDEARLAQVLRDEAAAAAQLGALEAAHRERLERKRGILAALAAAEKQVAGYIAGVAATKRKVVYNVTEHLQRGCADGLSRCLQQAVGECTPRLYPNAHLHVPSHAPPFPRRCRKRVARGGARLLDRRDAQAALTAGRRGRPRWGRRWKEVDPTPNNNSFLFMSAYLFSTEEKGARVAGAGRALAPSLR